LQQAKPSQAFQSEYSICELHPCRTPTCDTTMDNRGVVGIIRFYTQGNQSEHNTQCCLQSKHKIRNVNRVATNVSLPEMTTRRASLVDVRYNPHIFKGARWENLINAILITYINVNLLHFSGETFATSYCDTFVIPNIVSKLKWSSGPAHTIYYSTNCSATQIRAMTQGWCTVKLFTQFSRNRVTIFCLQLTSYIASYDM
jgi:hypothetical protein